MTAAECFRCGGEATETVDNGYLCDGCISAVDGSARDGDDISEAKTDDTDTTDAALGENRGIESGEWFYPAWLEHQEWWVNWVKALPWDDGEPDEDGTPTKQPVAPYRNGHAKPVRWNSGLSDEEYPTTTIDAVKPWDGARVGVDLHAPDRVVSDQLDIGIIIPVGQTESDGRTVTLIDWDDVRDPETEEIHPVCVRALAEADCYAEISQSGEGIHQIVFGVIPGGLKSFIRHIDDKPFVDGSDDLPMVEMYTSGRVCAMTGRHVAGTGEDVTDEQDLIDRLCWEFGTAGNNASENPTDPFASERDHDESELADDTVPSHDDVDAAMREAVAYDGDDPDEWEIPDDELLEYHAVLRARERSDELTGIANWELIGYAAALGHQDGLSQDGIVTDLKAHPTPQYGFDRGRATKETRGVIRKMEAGDYEPPSRSTLARRGILPERYAPKEIEHVAVLPDSPATRAATNGWDWTSADQGDETLTQEDAWDRTTDAITGAIERCDDVLIEALPTMGKSYSAAKSTAETAEPTTIATNRGRKEQYDQYKGWCDEHGLSYIVGPSFWHDCPTANGEHGDEWTDKVKPWYDAGATPQEIHKFAEGELGRPLPCQAHEGECPYSAKWRFDPDDYDVIICHYKHLHNEKVTTGRSVLIDEFPGAYETTLAGNQLSRAVSTFLEGEATIPFDDYTDLIENRDDDAWRGEALLWFEDHGVETDGLRAFTDGGHALAPVVVYTLLASDDLGNGWERATIGDALDGQIGLFNRAESRIHVMDPPALDYARNVIGLDGTPTPEMWRVALGRRRFNHRPVLQDDERAEYVRDALGLRLVQTTDSVKSYSAGESEIANRVTCDEDAALLEAIGDTHGQRPDLITTARAEKVYDDEGVLEEHVSRTKHYGNVLGSNEFATERLGAVIGSRNFGPNYVKKWGAYLNETVEPQFPGEDLPLEAGVRTDYGEVGNRIRKHMTEHETFQAVSRFGRDGNGATVYVHTNTLPDWVPTAGEGRVLKTWSDGMRQVIDAARDLGEWTTAELTDHSTVEIGERQVRTHLWRLVDRDALAVETEGCGYVWQDDGLHRVNDHGDVELESVDADDLDEDESAEVARMSYYRWDFRTSPGGSRLNRSETSDTPSPGDESADAVRDPPPNPGD